MIFVEALFSLNTSRVRSQDMPVLLRTQIGSVGRRKTVLTFCFFLRPSVGQCTVSGFFPSRFDDAYQKKYTFGQSAPHKLHFNSLFLDWLFVFIHRCLITSNLLDTSFASFWEIGHTVVRFLFSGWGWRVLESGSTAALRRPQLRWRRCAPASTPAPRPGVCYCRSVPDTATGIFFRRTLKKPKVLDFNFWQWSPLPM